MKKFCHIINSLILIITSCIVANADKVILKLRSEQDHSKQLDVCALQKAITNNHTNKRFRLIDLEPYNGCSLIKNSSIENAAAYMRFATPSCTFAKIVGNLQANNPEIAILGSDGPWTIITTEAKMTVPFIFIPMLMADSISTFLSNNPNSTVFVDGNDRKFDASLIVIWFIALFAIIIGSMWTKHEFKKMLPNQTNNVIKRSESNEDMVHNNSVDETTRINEQARLDKKQRKKEEENKSLITLNVSYMAIFVLLIIVVAMLLLLYFFYNVMIYFIYVLFGFGSATAIYRVGCLIFEFISFGSWKFPQTNIPYLKNHRPEYRKILLAFGATAVSVVWFVFRNEEWIWIIQNIMAFSLSINALSYYRIETYKTITILLSVFFIYDIFMVFVTPQFTQGTSIMEAVAFGGKDAQESTNQDWNNIHFRYNTSSTSTFNRLPVVLIVPHLSPSKRLCDFYYDYSYSLLGLGDILIPGLSVNYAIIYDFTNSNKLPFYFMVNIIAYFMGLMFAFIGLIFMNTAQPALLYLCPVLLSSSIIVSLIRGEFKKYWLGEPIKFKTSPKENKSLNESKIVQDL